ncbi:MAG: efflux RND transporter outer membrane subunit OprB [Burkholderiaceae bacterium]
MTKTRERGQSAAAVLAWSLMTALISGCSLAPMLAKPEPPIAATFPNASANVDASARMAVDMGWRDFFPDPRLQAFIEAALAHNMDLRTAVLQIEESRALLNIQRADLLPTANVTAGGTRSRTLAQQQGGARTIVTGNYQVGVGLSSFELDFFGRVHSLNEVALAQFLATAEARQSVQISLIASVAQAYLNERSLAEQLTLAQNTSQGRQKEYELAKQRFDVGASSALDLRLAETQILTARVAASALARQRAQAWNALTLLVGQPIDDAQMPPTQTLSSETIVTGIPAGLPSDLLINRPDIRAAERRLHAANANIGAARAAFFPRLSLTAGIGTASTALAGLFDAGSGTWTFGPQLLMPIFDVGRNRANLTLAQVRTNLAVASYERTIQTAFREVADALVARGAFEDQILLQQRFVEATADRLRLAELRYQNGVASSLDVLDAERDLFNAQQSLIQTRQQRLNNAIDLYRSLGGGIVERTVPYSEK